MGLLQFGLCPPWSSLPADGPPSLRHLLHIQGHSNRPAIGQSVGPTPPCFPPIISSEEALTSSATMGTGMQSEAATHSYIPVHRSRGRGKVTSRETENRVQIGAGPNPSLAEKVEDQPVLGLREPDPGGLLPLPSSHSISVDSTHWSRHIPCPGSWVPPSEMASFSQPSPRKPAQRYEHNSYSKHMCWLRIVKPMTYVSITWSPITLFSAEIAKCRDKPWGWANPCSYLRSVWPWASFFLLSGLQFPHLRVWMIIPTLKDCWDNQI